MDNPHPRRERMDHHQHQQSQQPTAHLFCDKSKTFSDDSTRAGETYPVVSAETERSAAVSRLHNGRNDTGEEHLGSDVDPFPSKDAFPLVGFTNNQSGDDHLAYLNNLTTATQGAKVKDIFASGNADEESGSIKSSSDLAVRSIHHFKQQRKSSQAATLPFGSSNSFSSSESFDLERQVNPAAVHHHENPVGLVDNAEISLSTTKQQKRRWLLAALIMCAIVMFLLIAAVIGLSVLVAKEKNANGGPSTSKSSQLGVFTFTNTTTAFPTTTIDEEPLSGTSFNTTTTTSSPTSSPSTGAPTASPSQANLSLREGGDAGGLPNDTVITTETLQVDVVIIGSGWAGLAAMDSLAKAGITNARILEARDYVGGRTHTVGDFIPGLPVEEGSEWVYSDTSVQTMLEDLNLPYGITGYNSDNFAMYEEFAFRGPQQTSAKLTPEEMDALMEKNWSGETGFLQFAADRAKSLGDGSDTDFVQTLNEYFAQTPDATAEDRQFILGLGNSEISTEYAASLKQASVKEIAPWLGDGDEGWIMQYTGVKNSGYGSLISSLAEPYLSNIELKSRVTTVNYGEEGELAQVAYVDATGAERTIDASAVLVTVPLGVLKAGDIQFVPALPQSKLAAMNAIGYGTLNKCHLYWQDEANAATWWPESRFTWLDLTTESDETSGAWTSFFNPFAVNGGVRLLTGFVAGESADAMVTQTDAQVVATALANLRTMLGPSVPEPTKYKVMRWNQDEFSKGSYSFPSATNMDDWGSREELGLPVGNLFFAGEATDLEWYGTTAGARDSGVRAGDEIASILG